MVSDDLWEKTDPKKQITGWDRAGAEVAPKERGEVSESLFEVSADTLMPRIR